MSWLERLLRLRRGPSDALREAREVHEHIIAQRAEVEELTSSLRESRRQNHLAPLIEQALRSTR